MHAYVAVAVASSAACDSGGYAHCERVEHAESCQSGDGFWCTCQKGFSPQGINQSSTCVGKRHLNYYVLHCYNYYY